MAPEHQDAATSIAQELVNQLKEMNRNSTATRELLIEVRTLLEKEVKARKVYAMALDELCGRMQVFSVAADILGDVSENGSHVGWKDVVHAFNQATDEVFPSEDGDEGEEDDGDDDGGDDGDDQEPVGPHRKSRRIS